MGCGLVVLFMTINSVKITDIEYGVMLLHFCMIQPFRRAISSVLTFQISIICGKANYELVWSLSGCLHYYVINVTSFNYLGYLRNT